MSTCLIDGGLVQRQDLGTIHQRAREGVRLLPRE